MNTKQYYKVSFELFIHNYDKCIKGVVPVLAESPVDAFNQGVDHANEMVDRELCNFTITDIEIMHCPSATE